MVFGPMTLFWTNGSSDRWVFGPMGCRTNGTFSDQCAVGPITHFRTNCFRTNDTFGPMDLWTNGFSDQWAVGPMSVWTNGLSDQWTVRPMGCQTIYMGVHSTHLLLSERRSVFLARILPWACPLCLTSGSYVIHAEVGCWVNFHEVSQDLEDFQQIGPESAVLVLQRDYSGALQSFFVVYGGDGRNHSVHPSLYFFYALNVLF